MFWGLKSCLRHVKTYVYTIKLRLYILLKSIPENIFRWIQRSASSSCYYHFPPCILLSKKSTEWSVGNFHTSKFRKFSGFRRDSGSHFSATLFSILPFENWKRYTLQIVDIIHTSSPLNKKKQQFPSTSKKWKKKIMNHLHVASNGLPPIFPPFVFQPPSDIAWSCKSPKPKPLSSKVSRHRLSWWLWRHRVNPPRGFVTKIPPGVKSWNPRVTSFAD